jgi:hypothetical protein
VQLQLGVSEQSARAVDVHACCRGNHKHGADLDGQARTDAQVIQVIDHPGQQDECSRAQQRHDERVDDTQIAQSGNRPKEEADATDQRYAPLMALSRIRAIHEAKSRRERPQRKYRHQCHGQRDRTGSHQSCVRHECSWLLMYMVLLYESASMRLNLRARLVIGC